MLSFKGVAELSNKEWFEQLPFIVIISVMAGVLGALFNIVHKASFRVGRLDMPTLFSLTSSHMHALPRLPMRQGDSS